MTASRRSSEADRPGQEAVQRALQKRAEAAAELRRLGVQNGGGRPIDPDLRKEAERLLRDGASAPEVALALEISAATAVRIAHEQGISLPKGRPASEWRSEARSLADQGLNPREIADKMNIPRGRVYGYLKGYSPTVIKK